MLNGYRIIDADAHVYEPDSLWQTYLEPAFRDFAPTPDLKIQGVSVLNNYSGTLIDEGAKQVARSHPLSLAKEFNPESQVQAMYQMGVDMAFIYPTYLSWISGVDRMA
ncbi:MAG: amidohydrolase, partial [Coleofasciculus sp. C2-GNP5-27]